MQSVPSAASKRSQLTTSIHNRAPTCASKFFVSFVPFVVEKIPSLSQLYFSSPSWSLPPVITKHPEHPHRLPFRLQPNPMLPERQPQYATTVLNKMVPLLRIGKRLIRRL